MKIKPMGEIGGKKLLSEMIEGTIKNEMKLNSLFGFDVSSKSSVPAYAMAKVVTIDPAIEEIFCDVPVDNIENTKEYAINPNYSIIELEKDENGNTVMPGFRSMNKEVDISFETLSIDRVDSGFEVKMKSYLSVENSIPNAPEKIYIATSSENEFTVYTGSEYLMITIVPSSMCVPILKLIDITDLVTVIYTEELEMLDCDIDCADEDYDILEEAESLDPEGDLFKIALKRTAEEIWHSEWLFYEIGNYDSPIGSNENDAGDFYGIYDVLYNSYYSKFTSKVIDTKTNEVKEEYKDLPMLMYRYDFENWIKYAEHEDLSRIIVPKYYYSNESGMTVEITPESKDKSAKYKMLYNGIEYYSTIYRPTGLPFGFSPFDNEDTSGKKLDKNTDAYSKCIHIVSLLPELKGTISSFNEMGDVYYGQSKVGSVKIAKDLSSVFFMTYCADSVNFQSKILTGLYDLKRDRRIFVSTIGMSNSVLASQENSQQSSSVYDYHIFTSLMVADGVELSVENILSLILQDDTGFVLRTINTPAEGKVTLDIKDKESKAKIAQKDSVFYNESKGIIYVRDMFGVPTPIQIG